MAQRSGRGQQVCRRKVSQVGLIEGQRWPPAQRGFTPAGIMRKDTKTAKLTEIEIARNKKISKKRYIRFQAGGWSSILV